MKQKLSFAIFAAILIAAVGLAAYYNSIPGKFVWDDKHLIKDNVYIKDRAHLPRIFSSHIGAGSDVEYFSYRPLQMLTYMIEYSIWKLDVRGYHCTNIMLHILVAIAIYWLITLLFDDRILSLFVGLMYVCHPIHVSAVTYISGRADPMAFLFMILCFILYIKNLDRKSTILCALMAVSYACAILSRENSLMLPALILLYHYVFKKEINRRNFISILAVAGAYIFIRMTYLSSLVTHTSSATTLEQRIPGFFVAITNYMKVLFLPIDLHMEYGARLFSPEDPRVPLGLIILLSILIFAFVKRKKNTLVFFSITWFFAALLPLSNLYPIPIAYMAEHWLYVPSLGFFLILAGILRGLYASRRFKAVAIAALIAIVSSCTYLTARYNKDWGEPVVFYKKTLEFVPDSVRTLNSLALEYMGTGKGREAIPLFEKAIQLNPKYARTYNNLGVLYFEQQEYGKAIELYNKLITIDRNDHRAYNNLGNAYSSLGGTREAIEAYKKAIAINPRSAAAYNNIGLIYSDKRDYKEAVKYLKKAVEINPHMSQVYYNISLSYFYNGQYDLSAQYCREAMRRGFSVPRSFVTELEARRK